MEAKKGYSAQGSESKAGSIGRAFQVERSARKALGRSIGRE